MIGVLVTCLQLQLQSHIELLLTISVRRISKKNLSLISNCLEISDWSLLRSNSRMHCHAVGIEVNMSNSSSVLLCCHWNAFVNICYRGNKC
jgi:hypothetical protein